MKLHPEHRRRALTRVRGRGRTAAATTRVVPHKHKDRRRPKTRELLREA